MPERERLPSRHECDVFDMELFGNKAQIQYSHYEDGRIGEVFSSGLKTGSDIEATVRDGCIAASIAFQQGANFEGFRRALTREQNGKASGALGRILDEIAKRERQGIPA